MSALVLTGVKQRRGRAEILRGIDLEVAGGETVAVLGPSGAGKTTLLRVVAGLDALTAGTVAIGGRDVTGADPGQRDVAMVFQSHALLPHLDVTENVAFGLRAQRVPKDEIADRVEAAAALARCDHLLGRRVTRLSGGERQRVALARAVARRPAVLLLDEPFANLDATTRSELRGDLRRTLDQLGATVVHVTHDQAEAMSLGHRIAVLDDGALLQTGRPDELYEQPSSLAIARFLGVPTSNVVPVSPGPAPTAAGLALPDASVPSSRPTVAALRPEAILVGPGAQGTVVGVDVLGSDALIHVAVGDRTLVARTRRSQRPSIGASVGLAVVGPVQLFDERTGARVAP